VGTRFNKTTYVAPDERVVVTNLPVRTEREGVGFRGHSGMATGSTLMTISDLSVITGRKVKGR